MRLVEINFLDIDENENYENLLNKVLEACFIEEKIDQKNLYINIVLTNPENIRKMNNEYRKIDKETDVLSFPMFERNEIESVNSKIPDVLGDIVISIERVKQQAKEYGHSFERELAYMAVHGFYHLMGYDHIEEDEKVLMREREENILKKLDILK